MTFSKSIWHSTSRCRLILLFTALALVALLSHIQTLIPISRFQHYGIAIVLFGTGWLLETAWSWRKLNKWARLSYISTCLFAMSIGLVFCNNSWLGHRVSIPTEESVRTERIIIFCHLVFMLYLVGVWMKWIREEGKTRST